MELLKERSSVIEKIEKAEDRFLANDITKETYDRMVERLEEQKRNINLDIELLGKRQENPTNYLEMAGKVLCQLDTVYQKLPYELKRAFVGSIFPGKLEISNSECRTTKINDFLAFLIGTKTKQATKNGGLSSEAPRAGLEPATP